MPTVIGITMTLSRELSATPGRVKAAPPTLGQHTGAVLQELGLHSEEIDALRHRRVI